MLQDFIRLALHSRPQLIFFHFKICSQILCMCLSSLETFWTFLALRTATLHAIARLSWDPRAINLNRLNLYSYFTCALRDFQF